MKVKVKNMTSNNGNDIANQFIISTSKGLFFQSYNSVIAFIPHNGGKIQLDRRYWDYSVTTGKYRNQFLGEGIADTRKKIADKTYLLKDLNK